MVDAMKPMEKKAPEATDHTYSYNLDYQFSKKFEHSQLTVGGTYERIHADSKKVTGQHSSDNVATFPQYDHKFIDRLNVSVRLFVSSITGSMISTGKRRRRFSGEGSGKTCFPWRLEL